MSEIQEILEELQGAPGVRSAAVVTKDGLVAAAALAPGLEPEVVGGLASFLMMTTGRSLREGGFGPCARLVLNATHGKAVLVQLDDSYLVVLFDQFADVDAAARDVERAEARARAAARLV